MQTAAATGHVKAQPEYVLSEDVMIVPAPDGTVRLLDLCGEIFALPATGGVMLQATLERGTDAAVQESVDRFAVEPAQARDDLNRLLSDLQHKRVLYRPVDGHAPRQRMRRAMATLLLVLAAPVARCKFFSQRTRAAAMLAVARASFAWCKWTPTLETWDRCWIAATPAQPLPDPKATAQTVDQDVRAAAARHWLRCECKERSICCWALARSAGLPVKLVIGMKLFPFAGHCWCESDGQVLSDDRENTDQYTPIARFS